MRYAKAAIGVVATAFVAIPSAVVLVVHASYLMFAPEQIGYRYFLVARLAAGEGGDVWQPQGQITSLLQFPVYWVLRFLMPRADVFTTIDAFGLVYGFLNVALFALVFAVVAALPRFDMRAAILIAAVPLSIIYLFGPGPYFMTEPSYHQISIVLFCVAVVWFVNFEASPDSRNLMACGVVLGVFTGLCAANKISMIFIAAPPAAVVCIDALTQRRYAKLAQASLIGLAIAVAVAAFILLALYGFRIAAAAVAFAHIAQFTLNPGDPEPRPLSVIISYLISAHFLYAGVALFTAVGLVVAFGARTVREITILGAVGLTAAAFAGAVFYRPAGHTEFDMACGFVSLCAMTLSLLPGPVLSVLSIPAIIIMLALVKVDAHREFYHYLATSRVREEVRERAWRYADDAGAAIIAIIPDDRWMQSGPVPALVKGLSAVPSWDIPPGQPTLAPPATKEPLTVRSRGNTVGQLGGPYPDDATLVWEDIPEQRPVTELDPALQAAINGRSCREWAETGTLTVCLPLSKAEERPERRNGPGG